MGLDLGVGLFRAVRGPLPPRVGEPYRTGRGVLQFDVMCMAWRSAGPLYDQFCIAAVAFAQGEDGMLSRLDLRSDGA